jgi:rod shape-determining protein MreB
MVFDHLLSWFSSDVGIAITGRSFWFVERGSRDALELPNLHQFPLPPSLPEFAPLEAREGVVTQRNLVGPQANAPVTREGWIYDFDGAELILKKGLRQFGSKVIGSRAVIASRFWDSAVQKRAVIESCNRAGARSVYLVEYPMTCAIGLGLQVRDAATVGLLALETDWFEFAALRYAFPIAFATGSIGGNHILDEISWQIRDDFGLIADHASLGKALIPSGAAHSIRGRRIDGQHESLTVEGNHFESSLRSGARRIAEPIRDSLSELTREQFGLLKKSGIYLCGEGANVRGLAEILSDQIGISVKSTSPPRHPAIDGVAFYLEHIDEWTSFLKDSGKP